jgi:homoserine kinase
VERVTVYAPGSAANLGPGFDCLGLAFTGKGDRVIAERVETPGVRVLRISDERIPLESERNAVALAAAAALRRAGSEIGLELCVEKGLPLGGGLGGSGASAVAGAVAADALTGHGLSRDELFEAALEAESRVAGRHGDNVAASLLGGCVLVAGLAPPRLCPVQVHASLGLVVTTPDYSVATHRARAVLPLDVPRGDAVAQAARLGALLLALERGDRDVIRYAMTDAIAEPARLPLLPGYAQARSAGIEAGALGVTVSGAGPSVVAFVPLELRTVVAQALKEGYVRCGIDAESHVAEVDARGARLLP